MSILSSVQSSQTNQNPAGAICDWPEKEPLWYGQFPECSEPLTTLEHRESGRLTKIPAILPETRFKDLKKQENNFDDLLLAGIILGGGLLVGGAIGLGIGAMVLAGCNPQDSRFHGVRSIGTTVVSNDSSAQTSLAFGGYGDFAISWTGYNKDDGNVYLFLSIIDGSGAKEKEVVINPNDSGAFRHYLIWNDSTQEYIVFWNNYNPNLTTHMSRIGISGDIIDGTTLDINSTEYSIATPVWNASWEKYGLSWISFDGTPEIKFGQIDTSGNKIGSEMIIAKADYFDGGLSMVRDEVAGRYGISWQTWDIGSGIRFLQIDSGGNKLQEPINIDSEPIGSSLVWAGGEYAVAWVDEGDTPYEPGLYFLPIGTNGKPLFKTPRKISAEIGYEEDEENFPSLVWNGSEYGISWAYNYEGINGIRFASLDESGQRIGDIFEVTNEQQILNDKYPASNNPVLVWTAGGVYNYYGLSFARWDGTSREIRFARLFGDFL